jgi:hypothetical protein
MIGRIFTLAICAISMGLAGCSSGGGASRTDVVEQVSGGVNPYLWRATLDTLSFLPLETADSIGGLINYNWQGFDDIPGERIKATVFILDTRLRADGVKVSVFRQRKDENGEWVDADVSTETIIQLENQILSRARTLKTSEVR